MEKKYPWEKKWTARTKEVAKFIPIYATILLENKLMTL